MSNSPNEKKYMTALRYGYIALFLISFAGFDRRTDVYAIMYLLFYLLNNQIRYFLLPKRKIYIFLSIIVEVLIAYILCSGGGNFGVIIFIPTLVDIIHNFSQATAVIFSIAISIPFIVQWQFPTLAVWCISAAPILLLLNEMKDQEARKQQAQELYDILREKDEDLKRVNKELESYVNTVEEIASLRERNRISREIHDNVGHALSTIIIQLGAIEKVALSSGNEASKMAQNLTQFTKECMEQVRAYVRAMKPREFEEYEGIVSISEMIKNFQKLTGIEVNLRVSDNIWRLNSDQTMAIYRIVQEFLSNSLRHGKATRVKIFLNFLDTHLRMHLKDNGVGCSKVVSGVGLKSIKERVAVWGGDVECFTEEGKGFELVVSMDKAKLSVDGV